MYPTSLFVIVLRIRSSCALEYIPDRVLQASDSDVAIRLFIAALRCASSNCMFITYSKLNYNFYCDVHVQEWWDTLCQDTVFLATL